MYNNNLPNYDSSSKLNHLKKAHVIPYTRNTLSLSHIHTAYSHTSSDFHSNVTSSVKLHQPPYLKCQPCLIPLTTTPYSLHLLSNHAFVFLQSIYHHLIHLYFIHYIFYLIILFIICFPTSSEHNVQRQGFLTDKVYTLINIF